MRIFAIIPAAGTGTRLAGDMPKQYLDLLGATILERSLAKVAQISGLIEIVVVIHPEDQYFADTKLPDGVMVSTTEGGASRQESVVNGITSLRNRVGDDDWILIHDAARPLVETSDVNYMVGKLRNDMVGGIMASPVVDTKKLVGRDNGIIRTLDRTKIWRAQTPQIFRFRLLQQALRVGKTVTDESQAVEYLGYKPKVFPSSGNNIKITTLEDLNYARWLLANVLN